MSFSRWNDEEPEQSEASKGPKRYRVELSSRQLFVYTFCLFMALSWMFAFGVLVGRGLPLVSSMDLSYRAQFLRFLGLGREVPPPPEKTADTWEDPKKMLESLNYYENLTQKGTALYPSNAPQAQTPAPPQKPAAPMKEQAMVKPKPPASPPGEPKASIPGKTSSPPSAEADSTEVAVEGAGEHFTLLIASLKDAENAQKLVDQLRGKGYPTRLEVLDLQESGRWNRVMVGSFRNRDEAQRFAADLNRKERLEGLVIRETN